MPPANNPTPPRHLHYLARRQHLAAPFGSGRFGARAETFARFFGTPRFLIGQTAVVGAWIAINAIGLVHFDLYPFILLNLAFSLQAAYAAPLILLSQNRTAERDRIKAEHDFDVNVLALRTLAELLGDVHDVDAQEDLKRRIDELLGTDPDSPNVATASPPADAPRPHRRPPAETPHVMAAS